MGDDGDTLSTEVVGDGGTLPQPEDPILNGSVFGGWYIGDDEYVFNTEIHESITLCAKWNEAIFDDIADLGKYLSKWSANDPENPYTVSLNIDDITDLRTTLNDNEGKYVYLDLSRSTTITTIPANTFYGSANPRGCATLTGITIPNSVNSIGNNAFGSCANLASVTIGSDVTSIGTQVFMSCPSLEEISINPGNSNYSSDNGVLYNGNKTVLIAYPSATGFFTIPNSVTTIGERAFQNCISLTSVTIGNNVTTIGNNAFYQCSGLTSVTIGSGVTTIGNNAFYQCSGLTSVIIGSNVTTIGEYAFYQCSGLTSVTIESGTIGNRAFTGCTDLTSVTIGSNVTTIGSAFGDCTKLDNVTFTLPSKVTTIGSNAFQSCAFTSITIPDSVTSIGNGAFISCPKLNSITFTLPSKVTTIGDSAFRNCPITSVTIPDSVETIGDSTFQSCTNLTSVTIGSGVTTIGTSYFSGCTNLTSITIGSGVTTIGTIAFQSCNNLTSVTFNTGSNIQNFGGGAFPPVNNSNSLKDAYDAASPKAGTYTRQANGSTWTKL
jgi:hypothetical protein